MIPATLTVATLSAIACLVLTHIARLEAALVEAEAARERYDKRPRGAGGQRMPDEIDDLLCRLYEIGAHPALRTQATEGGV